MAKKAKPLYVGLFPSPKHLLELKNFLEESFNLHAHSYLHHLTLEFKGDPGSYPLGKNCLIKIIGWAGNHKVQTLACKVIGADSKNSHPHITVAAAIKKSNGKPFPAVLSNELLEGGFTPFLAPRYLVGTVGCALTNGEIVYSMNDLP